jgi:hypothetical protein
VYGIKTAVRRLEFAPPKSTEMEVTDITTGRFVFRPRPDKPVSLKDLQKAVTKAGYAIEGTWIKVAGRRTPDGVQVPETGQVFHLEGLEGLEGKDGPPKEEAEAGPVTAAGVWKVEGGREIIVPAEPRPVEEKP